MTSVSSWPVVRLTSPGDIVAAVPSLCGFLPSESLVVLSLRGRRRRLGLTVRVDLPPADPSGSPGPPGPVLALLEVLAQRVHADGATTSALVVFAAHRRPGLVQAYVEAAARCGTTVDEALHVADGRWTSYTCDGPCCPSDGSPVPGPPELLVAEGALDGRAVLASRAELVAALAAPAGPLGVSSTARLETAGQRWLAERQAVGERAARRSAVHRAAALLEQVEQGRSPADDAAAELAVALHDVAVRDEVATWALDRPDGLLSLAEQVARRTSPPWDAPVCTLLAWVAYARGDGARANVALDRALVTDPDHPLALLLRRALDSGVTPGEVRRTLASTRRTIRSGRPRR
jgi:hypothetical protein